MDYSEQLYGSEFSAGAKAIISGGARVRAALSLSELPSGADFQGEIQSGADPMSGLRPRLLSGIRLFCGGNDFNLRPYDCRADSRLSGHAACAGVSVAFRNDEIRAVDKLYLIVGRSVRAAGVRAVAVGRLLAGALACSESEIICWLRLRAGA